MNAAQKAWSDTIEAQDRARLSAIAQLEKDYFKARELIGDAIGLLMNAKKELALHMEDTE